MASLGIYLLFLLQVGLVWNQRMQKGDKCIVEGKQSRCSFVKDCPSAVEAINQRRPLPICGFQGLDALICCPVSLENTESTTTTKPQVYHATTIKITTDSRQTSNKVSQELECGVVPFTIDPNLDSAARVARQKCHVYARAVFYEEDVSLIPGSKPLCISGCISAQELIVGGKMAKLGQFPHMALIGFGENNPSWLCGGSLISEKFVLSAAHCTNPKHRYGPAKWIKLGELNISDDYDGARPIDIKISNSYDHPLYDNDGSYYNDITLYELETKISFSPLMRPACLNTEGAIARSRVIAAGWGKTEFAGHASDHLQYLQLNMVSTQNCNKSYTNSIGRKLPEGILPQTQFCAGDELRKDTCQGDSGGPLFIPIDDPKCMYDIIGITSFGKGCGFSSPGVYTRVDTFIPWIVSIVWPEELNKEEG